MRDSPNNRSTPQPPPPTPRSKLEIGTTKSSHVLQLTAVASHAIGEAVMLIINESTARVMGEVAWDWGVAKEGSCSMARP